MILFLRSGSCGQFECLTHGHLQQCRGRRAVQLEAPYCVGGLCVGTHAVIALLVLFRLQSLPMEIQINDFSHIGGKYSEIPRDDRCSDVSPGLQESLAPSREVGGVLTLSIWVVVQLYKASSREDQHWRPEAGRHN